MFTSGRSDCSRHAEGGSDEKNQTHKCGFEKGSERETLSMSGQRRMLLAPVQFPGLLYMGRK